MDARTAESLLALAERTSPGLEGPDAAASSAELDEHHGKFLSAMRWFLEQDRCDECIRFANALAPYWTATKRVEEAAVWFDRVLESPGDVHAHRARALVRAGFFACCRGEHMRAAARYAQAVETGQSCGDPAVTASALNGLAALASSRGEWARAATILGAAEELLGPKDTAWPPEERRGHEELRARLSEAMGASELDRARAAGKAMPLAGVVGLALRAPETGARIP